MSEVNEKYNEMMKGIVYLTSELTEKRGDLDDIKKTIKQLKLNYNKEIKDYQLLTETILSNESLLETFQSKIAKLSYKQMCILNSFNAGFYAHFNDIATNNQHNEALSLIFEFCSFTEPIYSLDLISIMQNVSELISLMDYSSVTLASSHRIFLSDFELTKRKINAYMQNNKDKLNYPFDSLFEYMSLRYDSISLEEEKKKYEKEFGAIAKQKNVKFLNLKALEGHIIRNDTLYKTTVKYIKGVNALLEKNQERIQDKHDLQEMTMFLNAVKQCKSFDFSTCKYDNMNSLSIQSEYSDNNSIDTSSLLFKIKPNENSKLFSLNKIQLLINGNGLADKNKSTNGNANANPNSSNSNDLKMNGKEINSRTKIKKINSMTQYKKIKAVKPNEKRGSQKNKIIETTPDIIQKPKLATIITDENNNDIDNNNEIISQFKNAITKNMNTSDNYNKDSVCDEKINSSINPKRVETVNYITNANQVIRKKHLAFYLEYEHLENDHKLPGCCQSCT